MTDAKDRGMRPEPPKGKDGRPLPPPDGKRPPMGKDGRPLPPPDGKMPPRPMNGKNPTGKTTP